MVRCLVIYVMFGMMAALVTGCGSTATQAPASGTPTPPPPTLIAPPSVSPAVVAVTAIPSRPPQATVSLSRGTPVVIPTLTPRPTLGGPREKTTIQVEFDTYETEETIAAELGRTPGILEIFVTQTAITLTYDPQVINRQRIIAILRENPEVRVEEDP
jgi:hypothetical protein